MIRFLSTSGGTLRVGLSEALRRPIPQKGALWMPETLPQVSFPDANGPLHAFVEAALRPFAPLPNLGMLCEQALDGVGIALVDSRRFGATHELQLWHGPTQAFKDVGCRVAVALYQEMLEEKCRLVVATSGDTGGAVAAAAAHHGARATVLFPKGRVSAVQQAQMTRELHDPHRTVSALAVEGDFDACQAMAKEAVMQSSGRMLSANSVSLARLLPQIGYHAWAAARLPEGARFVVPSGNMGNVCAAMMAREMGAPIGPIHIACNENDAVPRFLNGVDLRYAPRPTVRTPATAMDVGAPSNWVRIEHLLTHHAIKGTITASATPSQRIVEVQRERDVCPHTAVAYAAAQSMVGRRPPATLVVATASPAKFGEESLPEPPAVLLRPENPAATRGADVVFLVGMPAVGKTTVGSEIADSLDLDHEIQRLYGESVGSLVGRLSSDEFGEIEREALRSVCAQERLPRVISTGGSVACDPACVEIMRAVPNSLVVWLDAPAAEIERRMGGTAESRGVVFPEGVSTVAELHAHREPLYRSASDVKIDASSEATRWVEPLLA